MSKFGQFRVTITQSTLYVEPLNDECDVDGAWEACGAIFSIASMCRCRACEKDLDAIFRTVVEYLGDELSLQSFRSSPSARTSASRSTRFRFRRKSAAESPRNSRMLRSMSTTRRMSSTSRSAKRLPTSTVRQRPARAVFPPARAGARRLLLSGGIDSPVAGYMIAKRGVEIECVHFSPIPIPPRRAKEKVLELARIMTRYADAMTVDVVGFTKVQEAIRDHCREEYFLRSSCAGS